MVVLVCGGREFRDYEQVKRVLAVVCGWSETGHITIVNGGARGADQLSTLWAQEHGEKYREFLVADDPEDAVAKGAVYDWKTYPNIAGFLRNQYMLDASKPDQAVAFAGQGGTHDMLTRLFYAGVNTWVVGKGK
jgi:hypothetical protein